MAADQIRVPSGLTTDGLIARRYLARFIDSICIVVLLGLVVALFVATMPKINTGPAGAVGLVLLLFFFWIGYGTLFESSPWQATLGKRFMGLRVYNSDGGRLDPIQAAGRNLAKDGPFIVLGFLPGAQLFSIVWLGAHLVVLHRSPVYQAIHDRLAHSWVAAPEATIQLRLNQ